MYLEGGRKEEEETQANGVLCAWLSFTALLNHHRQCSSLLHPLFLQLEMEKKKKGTVIILFFLKCCKD